jgi:hypothetical protein
MRTVMCLVIALAAASPAAAQDGFKDVWVTQADSGEVVRGRIVDLSTDSLSILTPDNRRVQLPLGRILRIEARGDSVKNGAIIGAAVMAGLSLFACQGLDSGGAQCVTAAAVNIAFGGAIGAGIDAMNGGRSTLYSRPAPIKPATAGGVQVRLRF